MNNDKIEQLARSFILELIRTNPTAKEAEEAIERIIHTCKNHFEIKEQMKVTLHDIFTNEMFKVSKIKRRAE